MNQVMRDEFYDSHGLLKLSLVGLSSNKSAIKATLRGVEKFLSKWIIDDLVKTSSKRYEGTIAVPCKYSGRVRAHEIAGTPTGFDIGEMLIEMDSTAVARITELASVESIIAAFKALKEESEFRISGVTLSKENKLITIKT